MALKQNQHGCQLTRGTPSLCIPRALRHVRRRSPTVARAVEFVDFSAAPNVKVEVHGSDDDVANSLVSMVETAAMSAINEKGSFTLAVPGGSVLKMLWGLSMNKSKVDWSKVYMFYVNHKCVPIDDPSSTHKKAVDLFLTNVGVNMENIAHLKGTPDAAKEAAIYEERLKQG